MVSTGRRSSSATEIWELSQFRRLLEVCLGRLVVRRRPCQIPQGVGLLERGRNRDGTTLGRAPLWIGVVSASRSQNCRTSKTILCYPMSQRLMLSTLAAWHDMKSQRSRIVCNADDAQSTPRRAKHFAAVAGCCRASPTRSRSGHVRPCLL